MLMCKNVGTQKKSNIGQRFRFNSIYRLDTSEKHKSLLAICLGKDFMLKKKKWLKGIS